MKEDERNFLKVLQTKTKTRESPNQKTNPDILSICEELNLNHKRAAYILYKWDKKGWYDYGVNIMFGWLTNEGLAACPNPNPNPNPNQDPTKNQN